MPPKSEIKKLQTVTPEVVTVAEKTVEFSTGQLLESLNTVYPKLDIPLDAAVELGTVPGSNPSHRKVRFKWTEKS